MTYWLADGIYSRYSIFVHTVIFSKNVNEKCLARHQEGRRKDVERAFGVLQAKWNKVAQPAGFWTVEKMDLIVRACLILHNAMVGKREKLDEELHDFYRFRVDGMSSDAITGGTSTCMWASFDRDEPVSFEPPQHFGCYVRNACLSTRRREVSPNSSFRHEASARAVRETRICRLARLRRFAFGQS